MKSIYLLSLLSLLLFPEIACGQIFLGKVTSDISQSDNILSFNTENASVKLEICSPEIVRVRVSWSGEFEPNEPYMVIQYDWPKVDYNFEDKGDHLLVTTDQLQVKMDKATTGIDIYNSAGQLLSAETMAEKNIGGPYNREKVVGSRKQLMPEEHFFGFGERMDFIDQRGKALQLNVGRGTQRPHIIGAYNVLEANYSPVPFFMSTRGYGIFLHNSYASNWDMGNTDSKVYSFEADGGELDYYFMYGPDFPSILDHYTSITGKAPLLPRFAHGLHVGTYSGGTWGHEHLTSTKYVVELVKKYRAMGIPMDILHLDSTWRLFGESGGKGATTFEWRETFKNPEAMFDSLYAMDVNMVGLHVRPRFDNGTKMNLLDEAREKGFVYPEEDNPGEFVNFFDEKAVDWWWENGVMRIAEMGAMFLKTDEGSAFGRKANESDKVGPTGETAEKLHNIFPIAYAKAPFERFSKKNGIRGMNHTREGYAGIQRYPFIWAGDWPSEWQYFEPVIKAGINIGMSGIGYWSHNMGGFEHDADPELFIRWVQFGMFSPVAHVFGMDHPGYKEPWNYGDKAQEVFTKYDKLRYQLIPYLYSNAWKMHKTGLPIMRALVLEHQDDENTYAISDQYYFGDDMIVCPVTTKDAQTRIVYLPEGTWHHYWTGEVYEGRQYYNIVTPLEDMPIFVKAGAIIPTQEEIYFDNKKPWGKLTFEVFPSEDGVFSLYEDDGLSEDYKENGYSITKVSSSTDDGISLNLGKAEGEFKAPAREYAFKVHLSEAPGELFLTRKGKKKALKNMTPDEFQATAKDGWYFDGGEKLLWVKSQKSAAEALQIDIE